MQGDSILPHVFIIPASSSSASLYTDVANELRANNVEATVHDLPSLNRSPPETPAALIQDSAFCHETVFRLCSSGKDVVLLAHSYGGMIATQCLQGLGPREGDGRASAHGHVVGIVYLAALVPTTEEAFKAMVGGALPNFIKIEGEFMHRNVQQSSPLQSAPMEAAQDPSRHASVRPQERAELGQKEIDPHGIPTAYIICAQDELLPASEQQSMVEVAQRESGRRVQVLHCDAGHCPNMTMPKTVARLVMAAIDGFKRE